MQLTALKEVRPISPRTALRDATSAAHERLHHIAIFAALAGGDIDRPAYLRLLRRLYGFHRPMEAGIARALDGHPALLGLTGWQRVNLLRADMTSLGVDPSSFDDIPRFAGADEAASGVQALGWLYVLEGSTLGGGLLARHLDHLLSKNSGAGRLFLTAGADRHHMVWKGVCSAIDEVGADAECQAILTNAAIQAFEWFEGWFGEDFDAAAHKKAAGVS
jgi:heme oxygenase